MRANMRLIESDGKRLLAALGLRIPLATFLPYGETVWSSERPLSGPCFVKPQVLSGRRGVSGLIRRCETSADVEHAISEITKQLDQMPCAGFLVEAEVPHTEEWLVSVDVDREEQCLRVTISSQGGAQVASAWHASSDDFLKQMSGNVPQDVLGIASTLCEAMRPMDALSIEINPLAKTSDGEWIALDAKIELDDLATVRHPEYSSLVRLSPYGRPLSEREVSYAEFLQRAGHRGTLGSYVELDGDVALILSGGGASLSALDALRTAGLRPANYVELSGNPDPASVEQAARIVLSKSGLHALWIAGSFANFTDIHDTIQGVLQAVDAIQNKLPIVIRRDGPRADEAEAMVAEWSKTHAAPVVFHRGNINLEESANVLASLIKEPAV